NLTVTNCAISGSPIGLAIGNNVTRSSANISNLTLSGNGVSFLTYGANAGSNTSINQCSITGSIVNSIVNSDANSTTDASCNWFGTTSSQAIAATILGN